MILKEQLFFRMNLNHYVQALGELNERTTSRQYRSGAVVWQLFSKSINQVNTHAGIQLFLEVNNRRGFFQDYIPIP